MIFLCIYGFPEYFLHNLGNSSYEFDTEKLNTYVRKYNAVHLAA